MIPIIALCAALVAVPGANANTPKPARGCEVTKGGATFAPLIRNAYAERKWEQSNPVTRRQAQRIETHRRCARNHDAWHYMIRSSRKQRRQFKAYREEQLAIRSLTPYDCGAHGHFAIPCYIVACESGYDFGARNSSSSAGGAYQIISSTWYGWGGSRYSDSHPAAVAPSYEQHAVARRIYLGAGASQWECA